MPASAVETWDPADAAAWIRRPVPSDDKYSRGVLGCATGSDAYAGAAVLGVEAALHTGIGMVRYLGPTSASSLVLARRPEAIIGAGRVQAWLVGSGMDPDDEEARGRILTALSADVPTVIDAGALPFAADRAHEAAILTPHAGELAAFLGIDRAEVAAHPIDSATAAANRLGAVVALKGATTTVTDGQRVVQVTEATPWLATAGAGDALAGILGALAASRAADGPVSNAELVGLGAAAAFIHGRSARLANERNARGPLTILDLVAAVPAVIGQLLRS